MEIKCHSQKVLNTASGLVVATILLWTSMAFGADTSTLSSESTDPQADTGSVKAAPESRSALLPNLSELVDAKLNALKSKLQDQDELLSKVDLAIAQEREREQQIFDTSFYLSMAFFNALPQAEYSVETSEVLVDGKVVSLGGPRNNGLPRNNERIYFAPLSPGCHEVKVKAKVIRLKQDLFSRFQGMNREENIEERLTIIAKEGFQAELDIEIFEAQNSIVKLYKNPQIRFNQMATPIFLPGSPLVSNEEVLNQGQVRIDYINDDESKHKLVNKTLSIDGLPILSNKAHDETEKNIVFEAPLAQGRHTLSVTLQFGEKTRIEGGPTYNFRLSFEREMFVRSGQTTLVNLVAMPDGGNRRNPHESRYARVATKVFSEHEKEIFQSKTCRELREEEALRLKEEQKRIISKEKVEPRNLPESGAEPVVPQPSVPEEKAQEPSKPNEAVGE